MVITDFDGEDVWFETLEPKWTVEEVDLMHQRRLQDALLAAGLPAGWTETRVCWSPEAGRLVERPGLDDEARAACCLLPSELIHRLTMVHAADHRERVGRRRSDGKQVHYRVRKAPLDRMADELGVPTAEAGWEALTLQALAAAPARGRLQ